MRLVRRAEHRGDAEDAKYAEDRLNEDKTWCPRNFLHTYRLALPGEKWALKPAQAPFAPSLALCTSGSGTCPARKILNPPATAPCRTSHCAMSGLRCSTLNRSRLKRQMVDCSRQAAEAMTKRTKSSHGVMEGAVGAEHNTVPRTGPFQFLCLITKTDTWLLAKCGPVHVPVAYALSPFHLGRS